MDNPVEALQGVFLRDEDIEPYVGAYPYPKAAIRALGYGDVVDRYDGDLTESIEGLLAISLYKWSINRSQLGIWSRCSPMELTSVVLFDWEPIRREEYVDEQTLEVLGEIYWHIWTQGCKHCKKVVSNFQRCISCGEFCHSDCGLYDEEYNNEFYCVDCFNM